MLLLVYDISDRNSFEKIKRVYAQEIKDKCKEDLPILLLGNKTDRENLRKISSEEGMTLALEENYEFQESCCINNINVVGAFEILIERWNFENHKKQGQIKRKNSDPHLKKKLSKNKLGNKLKKVNTERSKSIANSNENEEMEDTKSIKLDKENHKRKFKKKKKC